MLNISSLSSWIYEVPGLDSPDFLGSNRVDRIRQVVTLTRHDEAREGIGPNASFLNFSVRLSVRKRMVISGEIAGFHTVVLRTSARVWASWFPLEIPEIPCTTLRRNRS